MMAEPTVKSSTNGNWGHLALTWSLLLGLLALPTGFSASTSGSLFKFGAPAGDELDDDWDEDEEEEG